ncbi:MAG: DUF4282 domain-containing protein [Sulfuricurvum sp.]
MNEINVGRSVMDVLGFETFISVPILIFVYYTGALLIPFMLLYYRRSLERRVSLEGRWRGAKMKILALFIVCFLLGQIMWRMMFEVMIGYFQMHEYLRGLAH